MAPASFSQIMHTHFLRSVCNISLVMKRYFPAWKIIVSLTEVHSSLHQGSLSDHHADPVSLHLKDKTIVDSKTHAQKSSTSRKINTFFVLVFFTNTISSRCQKARLSSVFDINVSVVQQPNELVFRVMLKLLLPWQTVIGFFCCCCLKKKKKWAVIWKYVKIKIFIRRLSNWASAAIIKKPRTLLWLKPSFSFSRLYIKYCHFHAFSPQIGPHFDLALLSPVIWYDINIYQIIFR